MTITADDTKLARGVFHTLSDEHFALYLSDCERLGVHPLEKKLHPTVRLGRYAPVTSIDYMRLRAEATGQYAGSTDPIFMYPDGKAIPAAASVTVHKALTGCLAAFSATARWDEYYPGDGAPGQMWRRMPHVMLGKCAEALALRKGFPGTLSGLYAKEEMDQAGQDQAAGLKAPKAVEAPVLRDTGVYLTTMQRGELIAAATQAGWALGDLKVFVENRTGVRESAKILQTEFAPLLAEINKGPQDSLLVIADKRHTDNTVGWSEKREK